MPNSQNNIQSIFPDNITQICTEENIIHFAKLIGAICEENGTLRPYNDDECEVFDKDVEILSQMVHTYIQQTLEDDSSKAADDFRIKINDIAQIDVAT